MDALDLSNFTSHFTIDHVRQWKEDGVGLAIVQLIGGVKLAGDDCGTQIQTCLDGGLAVDCYLFPGNDGLPLSTEQRLMLIPPMLRDKVRQLWIDVEPAARNPTRNAVDKALAACDQWAPWQTTGTYCLTPDARVLTMDLDWVHAGELRIGDPILGFDEYTGSDARVSAAGDRRARRYKPAVITSAERRSEDVFEIDLANGQRLFATGEHKWLVGRYGLNGAYLKPMMWATTEQLASRSSAVGTDGKMRSLRHASLARFFDPWRSEADYAAGFLAAAFDGEGHLNWKTGNAPAPRLTFTQKPNAMLSAVRVYLDDFGYQHDGGYSSGTSGVVHLRLTGGVNAVFRFLGEMRPPRLLEKWRISSTEGVPFEMRARSHVPIEAVRFVGRREIAAISSSSQTYLAEGFGAHNSAHWVASKMGWLPWPWSWRKQWLVSVFNSGKPNFGGAFSGTNNQVLTQYKMDVTLAGVSGMDRSILFPSEAESIRSIPMSNYNVGPGVAQAMADHGDEPRSDEVFVNNTEGSKISQTYGRDNVWYWLQEDNAVKALPFR